MLTPTPLEKLHHPDFSAANIEVFIKRDDLNHPQIQGNKWHKLKYNLDTAKRLNKTQLITFGGAFSNHIAATAAAAKQQGFSCLGFIRGEELALKPDTWSQTLKTAQHNGMELRFLTREDYRQKTHPNFLQNLQESYPQAWILPEGGSNLLAVEGFKTLAKELQNQCPNWTHIITSVGTGGTLAGLAKHLTMNSQQQVLGVPAIGCAEHLTTAINGWIQDESHTKNWAFLNLENPIRYGKITPEIVQMQQIFKSRFNLILDPIYTAKMAIAFYQALQAKRFPARSKIILLHTGGLQGIKNWL